MGYVVRITGADWVIPRTNLGAAYAVMCDLNKHDEHKSGGSWSEGKQTAVWFAWMDANYPETCKDANAILEALGFETEYSADGDLSLIAYDSKMGSEELFLEAIAPYSREGSYLEWIGEDDEIWRHRVENRKLVQDAGRTVWESPKADPLPPPRWPTPAPLLKPADDHSFIESYIEGPRWALPEGLMRRSIMEWPGLTLDYETRTSGFLRVTIFFKVSGPVSILKAFATAFRQAVDERNY